MSLRERVRDAVWRGLFLSGGVIFGWSMIPLLQHYGVVGIYMWMP